jgi:hypothetical protein
MAVVETDLFIRDVLRLEGRSLPSLTRLSRSIALLWQRSDRLLHPLEDSSQVGSRGLSISRISGIVFLVMEV